MASVRRSARACRLLFVFLAGAAFVVAAAAAVHAADSRTSAVLPLPKSMIGAPTGSDLVGKLLAERSTSSDPDIPLPQRNLTVPEPAFVPLTGPRIYGRGEEGSVVLGLKIPIPAGRGASPQNTRYGGDSAGADIAGSAR